VTNQIDKEKESALELCMTHIYGWVDVGAIITLFLINSWKTTDLFPRT